MKLLAVVSLTLVTVCTATLPCKLATDCNSAVCPGCTCNATTGLCTCADGFTGKNCSTPPECTTSTQCNSAKCASCACNATTFHCQCADGYSGPNCLTPFCVNSTGCSGHGNCSVTPTSVACVCEPGFMGLRCEQSCNITCLHGGLPDPTCTTCTGCLGGWGGPTCNVFNTSIPAATLNLTYAALFAQHVAAQTAYIAKVAPAYVIPFWRGIGAGFDLLTANPVATNPAGLMLYEMTFALNVTETDQSGVLYHVPDQITSTVTPPPLAPKPETSSGFHLLTDLIDYQVTSLKSGQGLVGQLSGLMDVPTINAEYFMNGVSMSVYRTEVVAYTLAMKPGALNLTSWGKEALLSLPNVYNTVTAPVFEQFLKIYGPSFTTGLSVGGWKEDVVGWHSCIWKGLHPQAAGTDLGNMTGLQYCLLDTTNFAASVAARQYGGLSRNVSSWMVGGDPGCLKNVTCMAKTIAAQYKSAALIERTTSAAPSSILATLLTPTDPCVTALKQAEATRSATPLAAAQTLAQKATAWDLAGPQFVVMQTDAAGVCNEGPMSQGDTWTETCGAAAVVGNMTADTDGSALLQIAGGSPVSCGCSVQPVTATTANHLCFQCGVGQERALADIVQTPKMHHLN